MFRDFNAYPNYGEGHYFQWAIEGGAIPAMPLKFTIQKSIDLDAPDEEWEDISEELENQYSWQMDWEKPEYSRRHDWFYRCKLKTADDKIYYSEATGLYGILSKRDYLICRKFMRNKAIELRQIGGIPFHLYFTDKRDIKCPKCSDPVTGASRNPACPLCMGTGYINGYYGPIKLYGNISADADNAQLAQDGEWKDSNLFTIVTIGNPYLRAQETILADLQTGKRFKILQVKNLAEIRRMPILQSSIAVELNKNDISYFIGTDNIPVC